MDRTNEDYQPFSPDSLGHGNPYAEDVINLFETRIRTSGRVDSIRSTLSSIIDQPPTNNLNKDIPDHVKQDNYFWLLCMKQYLDLQRDNPSNHDRTNLKTQAINKAYDLYIREEASGIDAMTELFNRRSLDIRLKDIQKRLNTNTQVSQKIRWEILLIDIDNFKDFNTTWGHDNGDLAIKSVAEKLKEVTRIRGDQVFRFGGDEFVVLISHLTNDDSGEIIAESIRQRISGQILYQPKSELKKNVPIFISGAVRPLNQDNLDNQYHYLSTGLNKAKNLGRNCCINSKGQKIVLHT